MVQSYRYKRKLQKNENGELRFQPHGNMVRAGHHAHGCGSANRVR